MNIKRSPFRNGEANSAVVEIGEHIVADPRICHGKATYRGTRIMVWQILEALGAGESVEDVVKAWGEKVPREAILETIRLAAQQFLDSNGRPRHSRTRRIAA